jgi:O-antigen ligase
VNTSVASNDIPAASQSRRVFDILFGIVIVYYWLLQFARGDSVELVPSDIAVNLFIVPAAAVAVASIIYAVMTTVRLMPSAIVLIAFLAIVLAVSAARGDTRTIASMGMFAITLIALFQIRPQISVNFINILFILAIPITTFLYIFEYSIYTFIPGIGRGLELWWRISLFPSSSAGGLFAMVVFIINLNLRDQRFRIAMLALSIYFVVLSGNRTAIFAATIGLAFFLIRQRGWLSTERSRALFALSAAALFLLTLFGSNVLLSLPFADNEILRALIFRDESVGSFDVGDQLGTAAIRQWIFEQHWAAFRESPWVGIGTFDFAILTTGYGALDNSVTGSEAFVTGLLARIGLTSSLLFAAIFLIRQPISGQRADLSLCAKIALLIGMTTYGSFVNVYDVTFLLHVFAILGSIYVPAARNSVSKPEAPFQRVFMQ